MCTVCIPYGMPRDGKSSLTLNDETIAYLKKRKDDDDTWDEFLKRGARACNPKSDIEDSETKLEDQTWRHLNTFGCTGDFEIYWWEPGEMFLALSPKQQRRRKYRKMFNEDFENVGARMDEHREEWILKNERE